MAVTDGSKAHSLQPNSGMEQVANLLLQQREELFQRLDAWLVKADETLMMRGAFHMELPPWRAPPSTMTSEYIIPEQPNGPKDPETQSQEASQAGRSSPGKSPGKYIFERSHSEDGNLDHSQSKKSLNRKGLTSSLEEYEEAKEQEQQVQDLKKQINLSKSLIPESPMTRGLNTCRSVAIQISTNPVFNIVVALIIISNSIFLGVQLELGTAESGNAMVFLVGHLIYAILFTIEMSLRFVAVGPRSYLIGSEWYWNWLDLLVVIPAWVELITDFMEHGSNVSSGASNFRILRVLRITRMLHVIRSVRLIRVIHAFRELIFSILDTTRQLGWAMILLLLIIYSFSILFTDSVHSHVLSEPHQDVSLAVKYFGGVFISCETLFRACLSGFDWVEAADSLRPIGLIWVNLFHVYVAFCSFAVLNVITGVFVNSAIKTREKDHETLVLHVQKFKDLVSSIWFKLDTSGDGQLTITEFEQMFKDPDMQAFFEAIEVNAVDAWTLFDSLDADGDHLVSYEEFAQRCTQLHGSARAVDLFALTQQNLKVWDEVQQLKSSLQEVNDYSKYMSHLLASHVGDPMVCVQVA